tara:strand:- start:344 stop:448 length:105 start_codon:yes stop_codon:yes gene_type:complete
MAAAGIYETRDDKKVDGGAVGKVTGKQNRRWAKK